MHRRRLLTGLQETKHKDIASAEKISYNHQFTANLVRLKIQQVAAKPEQETERTDTQERIDEDRKFEYPLLRGSPC